MPIPDIEHIEISSFDGTRIAYQARGSGPAIVLSNGLGGSYSVWRHQYAALGQGYRIICWDYRGLYRSARPRSLATLSLDQQVKDLRAILDNEGIDSAVFIGWSMGVQFNFEYWRHYPEQMAAIVALNGTAGLPFSTAPGGALLQQLVGPLTALMKKGSLLISRGTKAATAWKGLVPLMKRLGLVGDTLDQAVFNDLAGEFAHLDFEAYGETFRYLGAHDARDVLPGIRVPTLIVTGTRDVMTPLPTARAMRDAIDGSRLEIVEGGTHYTAVEYPEKVNATLLSFLEDVGRW